MGLREEFCGSGVKQRSGFAGFVLIAGFQGNPDLPPV
jgi:hypothetical protein